MGSSIFKSYTLPGFFLAVIANFFIVVSLTQLIKFDAQSGEVVSLNQVTIADFKPKPPTPPKQEEPKEEKKEPQKEKEKIINPTQDNLFSKDLDMDLDMTQFEVNPNLPESNFSLPNMQVKVAPSHDFNKVFSFDALDKIPVQKYRKSPIYPYRAKRMGIEGEVGVSFVVNTDGTVSDVKILKANPKGIFEEAVIDSVSSWQYAPGELMGKNVKVLVTTNIIFQLEN